MQRIKDDLGSTVKAEDNLPRMIMIEQAIDAAYEIKGEVSKSYAFCDIIMAITDFARETNNASALEMIKKLLREIKNRGAKVRALCYYAVTLADFDHGKEAEKILIRALNLAIHIQDDFDRRDALLEIATAAGDLSFILDKPGLVQIALGLEDQLIKGQQSYLKGYLSQIVKGSKRLELIREATSIAESIEDPIARSKAFLDLANLLTNIDTEEKDEEDEGEGEPI